MQAILDANAEIRRSGGTKRGDLQSMTLAARIPVDVYERLLIDNPDLGARDQQIASKAWDRFLADPANKVFLVDERFARTKASPFLVR